MVQVGVANLRKELEQLFPGKWLSPGESVRALKTGLSFLDVLSPALVRRHLTEWFGSSSSGKTSVLRTLCSRWCASGLNIVYIDTFDRLLASDWCDVGNKNEGRFWVLRGGVTILEREAGLDYTKNALWACEQLIRSQAFDVVILDLAERGVITSSVHARLKRSLERSNTSLIVLRDDDSLSSDSEMGKFSSPVSSAAGRVDFGFVEPVRIEYGVDGPISITPTIRSTIARAILRAGMGVSGGGKSLEVSVSPYVSNRLFTHPPVPDRRTSKKR